MTQINPLGSNNSINLKPLTIEDLEEHNPDSIFECFDSDKSGTISDEEIRTQGFVGELFDKAKEEVKKCILVCVWRTVYR